MSWLGGIFVFLMIWWVVIFAVLPFGVRRDETPESGNDPGAPQNPMLWRKMAVATVISGIIWGIVYWAVQQGFFNFRQF
jgi:predicted secreted protein